MSKRLVITLDEAATKRYLEYAIRKTKAEIEADCEPSGITLQVDVSPTNIFMSDVYVHERAGITEIGAANAELLNN